MSGSLNRKPNMISSPARTIAVIFTGVLLRSRKIVCLPERTSKRGWIWNVVDEARA